MFERYTQQSRRMIFFARYEASQTGSDYIEPAHLLLGLLREAKSLIGPYVGPPEAQEKLRLAVEATVPKLPVKANSVDIPLAAESKKYMARAVELADSLRHKMIEPRHYLLAFLSMPDCPFIPILADHGIRLEDVMRRTLEMPPEDTDFTLVERLPFHLSVLRRIDCANRESIAEIGRLLVETIVPEGHDEIIALWRAKAAFLGVPESGIAFVEDNLLIQKHAAAETAAGNSN